ncbi:MULTISPECIES: hypothetical protein [unclassified Curtobacterium]|uniref:hypothetical protein n=1 Tax=unclassified Curtobacterium TaxID=257496 RepID=UPI0008DD8FA4|nr:MULTISPECIES: hypothetical protein [unclassified Curtobacterium]OIH94162.1 hypothetical protein BIU92_06940 [Curtobacterium sp. MCBA15_003]OII29342.1 hypothetical protein BIU94_13060 [Curtobacterium sp. MMLR14_006]
MSDSIPQAPGPDSSDDRARSDALRDAAHHEGEGGVDASEQRAADTAYSPSSERETVAAQDDQRSDAELEADGIDTSKVIAAPGTGGADDAGDVEPAPGDLHLPWQSEEDRRG